MNIAIITNKDYSKSETFIRAQIDNLPFNCFHYWGTALPFQLKLPKKHFLQRVLDKLFVTSKKSPEELFISDLKKNKIVLVLAQYGTVGAIVVDSCIKLNIPLIVHFHGHDAVRKSVIERYGSAYKKMFQYNKTKVISVSHVMTKRLKLLGCAEEKIEYNTYGPHEDFIKITPLLTKKQFIFIGRFVEKKAPHILLLAFQQVLEKHPDYQLVMAGDGVLLDSSITLAQALKIEKSVQFVGRITPSEYINYLTESVAYVQHSIEAVDGDMEGTPVSVLEASAAGLPVVSTLHAGIPDVIVPQKTGLLSPELDYMSMANNMIWVIENREKAIQMGKNGKEHIANNFSFEKHINGLAEIISKNTEKT